MTLIAAFRAPRSTFGPDGIAICADSQETVTQVDENGDPYDVRVSVQKIEPIVQADSLHVAIAGAGNATLIDGFIGRAETKLKGRSDLKTVNDTRKVIEAELESFYRNDVSICPDADKGMKLFVAVSCPEAQEYDFWESYNTVLKTPKFPAVIGWAHGMYVDTAKRLARPDMSLPQAVLASIYTLTVAKQTSNYVGGDLSVAVVRSNGIWMEKADYISEMESRLKQYESKVNEVFLHCADTSVSLIALEQSLKGFWSDAISLHRKHIDNQIQGLTPQKAAETNDPYPKWPLGQHVYFTNSGRAMLPHDRDTQQRIEAGYHAMLDEAEKAGFVRHLATHVAADKYTLCTIDWDENVTFDLGTKTKQEFLVFLQGHQMVPEHVEALMKYLEMEGNQATFLAPRPSVSQKSAQAQ